MPKRSWSQMSLARKISVLFGTAVLLTIAVTLIFPWLQMKALNEQSMLWQAKRVASVTLQTLDFVQTDFSELQSQLDDRWPSVAEELGLLGIEHPSLVAVGEEGPGFQSDAIRRLSADRGQEYFWRIQNDGQQFRLAMAVRRGSVDTHPESLRGIIDIRLSIPRVQGAWNSVATVLAGSSGAVLAILVFYMVTQRLVLSPVRSLRQVAEQVSTGDVGVRANIETGDEFQELAGAFNDMLSHLKAAQDDQERINRSLDVRLGELAATNVALFESNRLKSEFLANVTHELRTPLVSIIGFAELLRDAAEGKEIDKTRLARYSDNILTSGRSLLDIINDLLDLAKIEAGKLELHLSEFSIAELCRDLLDFVGPLADKRQQRIEAQLSDDLPECYSDSGKIKQILYNLLSNAVKFTPKEGAVSLIAERLGEDRIRLCVCDTGPGIDVAHRETIFEKFRQLDASQTREYEGTGLGLAITKELVQMLRGSIRIESELGEGSRFVVELPIRTHETGESGGLG